MTAFAPVSLPQIAPPAADKHVNYQLGMVLGVDDFVQEFAYSSARDKRIVRELIGYGVVSGLRVTVETEAAGGPRVNVAPGEAVTPSGQFVCISPAQCANLNDWLLAHRADVEQVTSPPSPLRLSVVACYAECLTDDVPIPGEPCRSDDELHKPSRVRDHFSLELRLEPPPQREDDALREFVAWVRSIPVVDGPAGDIDAFIDAIRDALELDTASPPDPLAFLFASPPPSVQIPRVAEAEYLAALFAFWASDLRARVRSATPGAECGCGYAPAGLGTDADCLALAELTVPVVVDAVSGALVVAESPPIEVRTERPTLLHLRLLQEWLLATAAGEAPPAPSGRFAADGSTIAARGGLEAQALDATRFALSFPGYSPLADYVVTGQPIAGAGDAAAATFEVLGDDTSPPAGGIVVRVRRGASTAVPGGFMVRIEAL
jgi:hypothetical protein